MLDYYDSVFKPGRFLLKCTGLRPFKTYIKSLVVFWYTNLFLMFAMTSVNFWFDRTFMDDVNIVITFGFCFHCLVRMTTFVVFEKELQEVWKLMENLWKIERANDSKLGQICFDILKNVERYQKAFITYVLMTWLIMSGHICATGNRQMNFYKPKIVPQLVFNIIQCYCLLYCALVAVGFDLIFTCLIVILRVQYKVLNQTLQNCLSDMTLKDERKCGENIKNVMMHHVFLKRLIEKINQIFGPMLFINIWIVSATISYSFYDSSEYNTYEAATQNVMMVVACCAEMGFFYVIPSQLLNDEMNKLFDIVYDSGWYDCRSVSIQRSLLIILSGKRTTAVISVAGRLVDINFATCTAMWKTFYTTFTFLRRMHRMK